MLKKASYKVVMRSVHFSLLWCLDEKVPQRLGCLYTWFPDGGVACGGLGGVAMLEQGQHWGWSLRLPHQAPLPVLLLPVPGVSSQVFLPACRHAAKHLHSNGTSGTLSPDKPCLPQDALLPVFSHSYRTLTHTAVCPSSLTTKQQLIFTNVLPGSFLRKLKHNLQLSNQKESKAKNYFFRTSGS